MQFMLIGTASDPTVEHRRRQVERYLNWSLPPGTQILNSWFGPVGKEFHLLEVADLKSLTMAIAQWSTDLAVELVPVTPAQNLVRDIAPMLGLDPTKAFSETA